MEADPNFRERRFRASTLLSMALEETGLTERFKDLQENDLIEFAKTYESHRREWTNVQSMYPELRGKDFQDKKRLEQEHQIARGYESGYNELSKRW